MIFASFVRDGSNVRHIRDILGLKGKNMQIISKIENHQGLKKFVRTAKAFLVLFILKLGFK